MEESTELRGRNPTATQMAFGVLAPQQYLAIRRDYGEIGIGRTRPHAVKANNGQKYLVKGPSLCPELPFAAANEYIAANLADGLGLPILDNRIVTDGTNLFFASSLMEEGTFYPAITRDLFNQCANKDYVYRLVVFDAWLCNHDRHDENLIVRHEQGRQQLLLLNDHSHCLITEGRSSTQLVEFLQSSPFDYIFLPFIRDAIIDASKLRQAVDAVSSLADNVVQWAVQTVPDVWLPATEARIVEEFLLNRKAGIRDVFRRSLRHFRNLGEGSI